MRRSPLVPWRRRDWLNQDVLYFAVDLVVLGDDSDLRGGFVVDDADAVAARFEFNGYQLKNGTAQRRYELLVVEFRSAPRELRGELEPAAAFVLRTGLSLLRAHSLSDEDLLARREDGGLLVSLSVDLLRKVVRRLVGANNSRREAPSIRILFWTNLQAVMFKFLVFPQ